MSDPETPLCQELHASSLDSNDIRAWRSLAYRLERGLTLLAGRSALSQEAVRDEALEEAAKVCDKHADDWLPHHIPEKGTSKNPIYWQQRHEAAERCAELIRALKREPNAAGGASDE